MKKEKNSYISGLELEGTVSADRNLSIYDVELKRKVNLNVPGDLTIAFSKSKGARLNLNVGDSFYLWESFGRYLGLRGNVYGNVSIQKVELDTLDLRNFNSEGYLLIASSEIGEIKTNKRTKVSGILTDGEEYNIEGNYTLKVKEYQKSPIPVPIA